MQHINGQRNGLLFFGDLAVLAVALVLTLSVRYREVPESEVLSQHFAPFSILFGIWLLVFLIVGLYDNYVSFDRKQLPGLVFKAQLINILLGAVLFFAFPFGIAPKTNLVIYLVISTVLITLWRLYLYPMLQPPRSVAVLLIGTGPEVLSVQRLLQESPYFQQVVIDHLDTAKHTDTTELMEQLERYMQEHPADLVIADLNDSVMQSLAPFFCTLNFYSDPNTRFFTLAEIYEKLLNRLPPSVIKETWLLEHISPDAPHYAYDFLKRTIDVVGALVLLLPCVVIFPAVVAVLKWQDGGAILYRTERIGQYNRPIMLYKFRTMTGMDTGESALQSKLVVTPVGAVMRKLRIDELPQLINVLRGELSFIGPRPELPALAKVYGEEIPYYNLRHLIKPGLSGWAQINNYDAPRQGVDVPRTIAKLSYDLYYLRHRSFLLDSEIALRTINTVLSRTGK